MGSLVVLIHGAVPDRFTKQASTENGRFTGMRIDTAALYFAVEMRVAPQTIQNVFVLGALSLCLGKLVVGDLGRADPCSCRPWSVP